MGVLFSTFEYVFLCLISILNLSHAPQLRLRCKLSKRGDGMMDSVVVSTTIRPPL